MARAGQPAARSGAAPGCRLPLKPGRGRARLPPPLKSRQPGVLAVPAGYGRLTGPLALMTWCHATGGWLIVHLPPERAAMARMLSL